MAKRAAKKAAVPQKRHHIGLRLNEDFHEAVAIAAEKDSRSVANFVEKMLREAMVSKGLFVESR